jgi:hypothetical protein
MREVAFAVLTLVGVVWIAAVVVGLLAKPLKLTEQRSWVGRLARTCRAVALLSP